MQVSQADGARARSQRQDHREPDARQAARAVSLDWLDALKGVAIVAVVFDHAFVVDDYLLWKHTYFHVAWFIYLAGVSNTLSARRRGFRWLQHAPGLWWRRGTTLLAPYLWVSLIAIALRDPSSLRPGALLGTLLRFEALPPLYFIPLLLQLLIAFPLLYKLLYRAGPAGRIAAVGGAVLIASALAPHITFPWALSAHYLLGASFLEMFVLGMLAAPLLAAPSRRQRVWWPICVALTAWGEWQVLQSGGAVMQHPPSPVQIVYATGLLGVAYGLWRVAPRSLPARVAAYLGRHSLDIFLYHFLFLLPVFHYRTRPWTDHLSLVHGQIVLVIVAVPGAIIGSLVAAHLSRRLYQAIAHWCQRAGVGAHPTMDRAKYLGTAPVACQPVGARDANCRS